MNNEYNPKEEEVETAFIEFLQSDRCYNIIGRQIDMPIGRLDVLAYHEIGSRGFPSNELLIAEIKRGTVDEHACTQLLGYMKQLDSVIWTKLVSITTDEEKFPKCKGILVGKSLHPMVKRIISTFSLYFCRYFVEGNEIKFEWNFEPIDDDDYGKIFEGEYSHEIEFAASIAIDGFFEDTNREFRREMERLTDKIN